MRERPCSGPNSQSLCGRYVQSSVRSSDVPFTPPVAVCAMSMCGTGAPEGDSGGGAESVCVSGVLVGCGYVGSGGRWGGVEAYIA